MEHNPIKVSSCPLSYSTFPMPIWHATNVARNFVRYVREIWEMCTHIFPQLKDAIETQIRVLKFMNFMRVYQWNMPFPPRGVATRTATQTAPRRRGTNVRVGWGKSPSEAKARITQIVRKTERKRGGELKGHEIRTYDCMRVCVRVCVWMSVCLFVA